jgi:hypothetical protein
MLAELNVLLHEVGDSLRSRAHEPHEIIRRQTHEPLACPRIRVLVSGLPSRGKAALVDEVARHLAPIGIEVQAVGPVPAAAARRPPASDELVVLVHAETDVEAMLEGASQSATTAASREADVIVPVDWEPVARSLARIVEALLSRGVTVGEAGV